MRSHSLRRRPLRSRVTIVTALAAVLVLVWNGQALAGFPEDIVQTVPTNGSAASYTSPFPAGAVKGFIGVAPKTVDESIADKAFEGVLAPENKGTRLLHCIFMTFIDQNVFIADHESTDDESGPNLQSLFLLACLRVALSLPVPTAAAVSGAARTTAPPCGRVDKEIGMTLTRTVSGYSIHVAGTTHAPTVALRARVSCRLKGRGANIGITPRVRGKTLRWAVGGSELGMGYVNRTTQDVGVKTAYNVR